MSFEAWYREVYPTLVGALTVVCGDRSAARDAAAEAMVRALEQWNRVEVMTSPAGWAYRVGVNVLRRGARRAALERTLLRRADTEPGPELAPEVWAAIRALPARQREAIALRYVLDLTEAGVAESMGVAVGTASATLTAARARLAEFLTPHLELEVN